MGTQRLSKGRVAVGGIGLQGGSVNLLRIPLSATTSTVPVSTGKSIPANSVVLDCYVRATSIASAATPLLDVGITSSTRGFLSGVNLAAAGVKVGSCASANNTYGALFLEVGDGGSNLKKCYPVDSASEVTYDTRSVAARLEGEIIITYVKIGG